jgi:hypothetical protein
MTMVLQLVLAGAASQQGVPLALETRVGWARSGERSALADVEYQRVELVVVGKRSKAGCAPVMAERSLVEKAHQSHRSDLAT